MGIPQVSLPLNTAYKVPLTFFATTPNARTIPFFTQDTLETFIRKNGRFWTHDYSLWPQWYFPGTKHLAFVRRRPSDEDLVIHPLGLIWYDLQEADFIQEPGSISDIVRVRAGVSDGFIALRNELDDKIAVMIGERPYLSPGDLRDLRFAQHGMKMTSVLLSFAPQSRLMTLLSATTFQRFYLETLAYYDYFVKWEERMLTPRDTPHPVDDSVIGLVTGQQDVAQTYYYMGVPVWLIRRASAMTADIRVRSVVSPTTNYPGMEHEQYPNTIKIFQSIPSPLRNRVSVSLRVANVVFGPSSREYHPGDPGTNFPESGKLPSFKYGSFLIVI